MIPGFRPATPRRLPLATAISALVLLLFPGCRALRPTTGSELRRRGDEIVVCGRYFHTGAPVVLWTDPGGYDAYRVERHFGPLTNASWEAPRGQNRGPESPNRYGLRKEGLSATALERVRAGGWDLPTLQRVVDQFVLHYDASGTSRRCFETLHDRRGLSVHFLLDVDGTLYQTLDLKERAWHATTSNTRSIGIEIAQAGAVPADQTQRLDASYTNDAAGVRLVLPGGGDSGIRNTNLTARPARPERVIGEIQGTRLAQYDFTDEQYATLARLTATLCRVFPRLPCRAPREADGSVTPHKLPEADLKAYTGVLGHYHIQTDKVDPGPAFQWDKLLREARHWLPHRLRRSSRALDVPSTPVTATPPAAAPASTPAG